MTPEQLTSGTDLLLTTATNYRSRINFSLRLCKKFTTTNPGKITDHRKAIMNAFEDIDFYLEKIEELCEIANDAALRQFALNEASSVQDIRRFVFVDGEMKEATVEEAAEMAGLTVHEYLAKEAEDFVKVEKLGPDTQEDMTLTVKPAKEEESE